MFPSGCWNTNQVWNRGRLGGRGEHFASCMSEAGLDAEPHQGFCLLNPVQLAVSEADLNRRLSLTGFSSLAASLRGGDAS